ncbi:MAG: SWIM zinc finger family protein [Melioribacteraceae bacterium]
MNMTLQNFDEQISEVIVGRGQNYFKKGRVRELEEIEPGNWTAEVDGTETYFVTVEVHNEDILEWDCECPFEGSICKHVVAVLYAITGNHATENLPEKERDPKRNKKDYTDLILQKVKVEELKNFLLMQFSSNKGLKNSFIAHFAEYLDEDSDSKYRIIVQNIYKAAMGRGGFIDYHSAPRLIRPLAELINKASDLLDNKNIAESLAICKTLLEEVPLFAEEMDDSDGGIGQILYSVFDLFQQIIEKAPPELKDNLFEYFYKEYPKEKYHELSFNNDLLDLISTLISLPEQEEQFFKLIDDRIEIEKLKSYSEFGIVRLTKTKVEYLLEKGKTEEAWKLIEGNRRYTEFLKMMIERAVKSKDYDLAIELCNEGISTVKKESHSWDEIYWKEIMLDIYEKKMDIKRIREVSEELFFRTHDKMKYYKKLKTAYDLNDWAAKCEKILDKIKGTSKSADYSNATLLADIFIEENYKDQLLKLLEINSTHIEFLDKYANQLKDDYPEKIIQLFEPAIKTYAMNTGRDIYTNAVSYLKKMQKLSGGEEKVRMIVGQFRIQYKNRRAMMEILNKNFPGI